MEGRRKTAPENRVIQYTVTVIPISIRRRARRGCPRSTNEDTGQPALRIYTVAKYIQIDPRGYPIQVSRWGNSLAVRLPAAVVEALELQEGDDIEIQVEGSRSLKVSKVPDSRELLARLRKYRGRLPDGFRFDRLEAHERG